MPTLGLGPREGAGGLILALVRESCFHAVLSLVSEVREQIVFGGNFSSYTPINVAKD